jgi:bacteriorhodopsin
MLTVLTILLVLVLIAGVGCLLNAMISGCPFAWVWYIMGGMGSTINIIISLVTHITNINSND